MGYITTRSGEPSILMMDNVTSTFFPMQSQTGLRGNELIVYSYLCNKSERYDWVDKRQEKIAEELNMNKGVLVHTLTSLYYKGFLWRRSYTNKYGHFARLKPADGRIKPVRKGEAEYWR